MILPITLSAEEYETLISALAQRDPLIAGLMRKQAEAQQVAAQRAAQADEPPSELVEKLKRRQARAKAANETEAETT